MLKNARPNPFKYVKNQAAPSLEGINRLGKCDAMVGVGELDNTHEMNKNRTPPFNPKKPNENKNVSLVAAGRGSTPGYLGGLPQKTKS
jgi:hypothetical protein